MRQGSPTRIDYLYVALIITMFHRNSCGNANSADPDQTPRYAASDLGLH